MKQFIKSKTHQKESFKVPVPFLQHRGNLIDDFAAFDYVFVFDDLSLSNKVDIRLWENAFQSSISVESEALN